MLLEPCLGGGLVRKDLEVLDVGDVDHLKVFAKAAAAEAWFKAHEPEGAAFEYDVEGFRAAADPSPR